MAAFYLLEDGYHSSAGNAAAAGESGGQSVHSCLIFPQASLFWTKQPNSFILPSQIIFSRFLLILPASKKRKVFQDQS